MVSGARLLEKLKESKSRSYQAAQLPSGFAFGFPPPRYIIQLLRTNRWTGPFRYLTSLFAFLASCFFGATPETIQGKLKKHC